MISDFNYKLIEKIILNYDLRVNNHRTENVTKISQKKFKLYSVQIHIYIKNNCFHYLNFFFCFFEMIITICKYNILEENIPFRYFVIYIYITKPIA